MDFETSLANIKKLKNFIMPLDCPCIYFNFRSETEFTVEFIDDMSYKFMNELTQKSFQKKLPYVRILSRRNEEVLIYVDDNIDYEYDFIKNKVLYSRDCRMSEADMNKVREQFIELFAQLKKIS